MIGLQMRELTAQAGICGAHCGRNRDSGRPHFPTYVHPAPVTVHRELISLSFPGSRDSRPCVCICPSHFCDVAVRSEVFVLLPLKFHSTFLPLVLFAKVLSGGPRGTIISVRISPGNRSCLIRFKGRAFMKGPPTGLGEQTRDIEAPRD